VSLNHDSPNPDAAVSQRRQRVKQSQSWRTAGSVATDDPIDPHALDLRRCRLSTTSCMQLETGSGVVSRARAVKFEGSSHDASANKGQMSSMALDSFG